MSTRNTTVGSIQHNYCVFTVDYNITFYQRNTVIQSVSIKCIDCTLWK